MIPKLKTLLLSGTSKDTFITLAGNAVVALGGMLFTILIARSLNPSLFGIFSAIFALVTLFSSLADLGISSALINFIPKLSANRSLIVSVIFWLQLIISAFLLLLILGIIPFKTTIIPGATNTHLLLTGLLTFILAFETFGQSVLKADRRFAFASVTLVVDSLIKLVLTYLLFIFSSLDIDNILISAIAASSLATAIALSGELKNISPLFPKKQVITVIQFAKWIAVLRLFSVFISRIDVILLNALSFDNGYSAGVYAAASRISLLFVLVVSSLGSVVAPRFSAFTQHQQVKKYITKLTYLTLLVMVAMLLTIPFTPLIIRYVFGPEYFEAIPVFRYMTLAMIPFLLAIITTNPLIYYFNKPQFVANLTIVQVIIIIVLDLALIPTFGPIAPTISLAVSNIVLLAVSFLKLKSVLK